MLYIDEETGRRVNIHGTYKGFSKLDTPEIRDRAGVIEIKDDPKPEDFSDDIYYPEEDWNATTRPYIVYKRRPQEVIDDIANHRLIAEMGQLESNSVRAMREAILTGDHSRLQELEDRISVLRKKIKTQAPTGDK